MAQGHRPDEFVSVEQMRRCDDMLDNPNIVLIQDAASQWGQGTIRSKEDEHLGRSDLGVNLMRRVYERELRKKGRAARKRRKRRR